MPKDPKPTGEAKKLLDTLAPGPALKDQPYKTVRVADMKSGMFVYASAWVDELGRPPVGSEAWFALAPHERVCKPVGDPLKVLVVSAPFFTAEVCQNGMRGVLDSRLAEWTQVDLRYVRSLVPTYGNAKRVKYSAPREAGQRYTPGQGWTPILKDPGE